MKPVHLTCFTNPGETAVCNLASIALPKYVKSDGYDYEALHKVTKIVTKNLNKVIDRTFYPVDTARTSNMRHRPIGLGVQGLADVFCMLRILGNNECFEPWTTNIYLRRTLAGEFVVVNKHLIEDLKKANLWSKDMKDLMVKAGGSIQNITDIPDDIKKLYKTVWEISQKTIIDMARDRGRYIDQSQSMNLFIENPTMSKLSSMHMYAWKSGLKTGMYYLRSKAKARPIQYSLEAECTACSA